MRIIAGIHRGRRLEAPDWAGLRPTSDRLRETLFNVLAPHIAGARFLDAYAGTGAVGIEALSRGASHVTFVEQDRRAQALIQANLDRCGVTDRYAIIRAGFKSAAKALDGVFDVLFLDPPYGAAELAQALETAAPLVTGEAFLVLEHGKRDAAPEEIQGLTRTRKLVQGDSVLSFFRRVSGLPQGVLQPSDV
jgi:16S rRNA (guanine(966)-N(2))-methyltransferase RsmD